MPTTTMQNARETGLRPVYGAIAPNGFLPTRE